MIIGVSGKINSGKDTVGSIIQYLTDYNRLGYTHPINEKDYREYLHNKHQLKSNWQIKKYADKLKDIVCILLSCTREQLEDRVYKETPLGEEWWYVKLGNSEKYKLITVQEYKDYIKGTTYIFNESDIIKLTPRLLLQLIGTECGRQIIHPNVWVNATMIDYKLIPDSSIVINTWNDKEIFTQEEAFKEMYPDNHIYPNWIITDVRFPNEADAITKRGGINIRIQKESDDYIFDTTGKRIIPNKEYINTSIKEHESETALDLHRFNYIVNHGTIEALIEQVREILIKENII